MQDGRTLTTDGPFAETKEALGGWFLEADDLDAAIEVAAESRPAGYGGAIEVRPVVERWSSSSLPRAVGPRVATLVGFLGDFDLAEEAAQEAFAVAAERWPRDGMPANPGAWLRDDGPQPRDRPDPPRPHAGGQDRAARRARGDGGGDGRTTHVPDERLELIFMCCHPALATDAQVALTLRALGGLTTEQIARAFLVPEPTMAPAARARQAQDQAAGIPFRVPAGHLLPERLAAVLAVVYLIFNEGYGGRGELAAEAIRLGRALAELMPDEPEVHGLHALMLLHDSRRDARVARRRAGAARRPGPVAVGRRRRSPAGRVALDRALACGGRGPTCCRPRSPRCTRERPARLGADRRAVRRARRG